MAKAKGTSSGSSWRPNFERRKKKRTSIGRSKNSRPKNKRSNRKKYRGQGK